MNKMACLYSSVIFQHFVKQTCGFWNGNITKMLVILDENSIHAVLDTCIKQNKWNQTSSTHIVQSLETHVRSHFSYLKEARHSWVSYNGIVSVHDCSNVIPSFVQHLIFLSFNILVQQFNQSVFCQIDLFKGKLNVQFGNFIFF